MEVKQKTGLGYDFFAIPPPFNDNYTSVPHLSFNTPPDVTSRLVDKSKIFEIHILNISRHVSNSLNDPLRYKVFK